MPAWPCSACANPMQNSPARPPRPLEQLHSGWRGRMVTVVSPPLRITQGLVPGLALATRHLRAPGRHAPCPLRGTRLRFRRSGCRPLMPAARAASAAAASSDCCGVAIMRHFAWRANAASPGFTRFECAALQANRPLAMAGGTVIL